MTTADEADKKARVERARETGLFRYSLVQELTEPGLSQAKRGWRALVEGRPEMVCLFLRVVRPNLVDCPFRRLPAEPAVTQWSTAVRHGPNEPYGENV